MKTIGIIFALLVEQALNGLHLALEAWATSHLWAWFAVPLFHLPALPIVWAAGLHVLVAQLGPYKPPSKAERERLEGMTWGETLGETFHGKWFSVFRTLLLLAFGWAIQKWWLP